MNIVEPQVFIVGESDLCKTGLAELLESFGTPEWFTDSPNSAEVLVEVAGKLCFDSETEILTKRGWVMFPELNEGEEVFTLNKQTHIEEWQVPFKVHTHDYNDELVCFEGRDLDFKVTKDHRFWARGFDKEWSFYVAGESMELGLDFKVGGCHWNGYFPSQVRLEGCKFLQKQSNHTGKDCGVRWQVTALPKELSQEQMESFAYLIAYFVTEGTINEAGTNKRATIYGTPHVPEIRKLCADLGVTIGTYRDKRNGVERACINSRQIADYLEKYCNHGSSIKKFPQWVLDLPRNVLEKVWSILVATDGHRYENGTEVLVTVSHELAGQAQEILTKIGFHGSISSSIGKNYPVLTVRKKIRDVAQVNSQKSKMYLEKYQGTVHCVTTQNGVVYVRRNGKCHWSGNCYMSFDTSLNENLTATGTRNNFTYIQEGLIGTGHLSVLEHVTVSIAFKDVSRIFCYHPDTEILTNGGWRSITEISDNEVLLTKNPITGVDRWSVNNKLHSFDYDGWLLGSKSSQWESPLVTTDHLMWVKKYDVRTEPKYEKVSASWVQGLRYYQDHAILYENLPACLDTIVIGEYSYSALLLYRWLGWVGSDGCVNRDNNYCSVTQSKKNESDELDELHTMLFADRFQKYGEGYCEWRVTDKHLRDWVIHKFGERTKAERSFVGMFEDHPHLIEAFLGGMLAGDGSMAGGTVPVIYCHDEITAKHLQVLVALTGRSSNVRVDLSRVGQSRFLNGVEVVNNLPAVCLHIHQSGESLCKKSHQYGVRYKGMVYCPQTEDGLVYVRNKGRAVWSGNTHELVRHRVGAAYSQTSGRYVRNSELNFWVPSCIKEDIDLAALFDEAIQHQEAILKKMVDVSGINRMKGPEAFHKKKQLTSAFRRIVGNGVATNIMATYNHRALRHIIELRTSRHAEEEIRLVFNKVFSVVEAKFPAFYDDAKGVGVNGLYEITFAKGNN